MKEFKFLDDKSDIEGMEFMEHTIGFNDIHFKVQYYTDLSSHDQFNIRMHVYKTLGSENMELEENITKFRDIMGEFYHRVIIERTELDDSDMHDFNIENVLDSVEPEERNFIEEMITTAAIFLFEDAFINRKIYNGRYGRVRYLDHIKPERNEDTWEQSYIVLATKRELDTISHNTNNIWVTVIRYDNREGEYHLHDRIVMNGEGIRINNVPYVITL